MGVTSPIQDERYRAGEIVIVRRGKYAGKPFAVVGRDDGRI